MNWAGEPSRGAQVLLSEVEIDERKALLRSKWTGWTDDGLLLLLNASWFQGLTLSEVTELTLVEGWDWAPFLEWDNDWDWATPAEPSVEDVVEFVLQCDTQSLIQYATDWVWDDVTNRTDELQAKLAFIRRLADTYGFSVADLAYRVRWPDGA